MTKKLSIAFAAGLLLAGPAMADDQGQTQSQTKDPLETKDAAAGVGTQVKAMAREQKTGEGAMGIGMQVGELAQLHGCDERGSAECKAHTAVHGALADKAGPPTDPPSLPGEPSGMQAAEHHPLRARHDEVEQAAMRHTHRRAAGEPMGEAQAGHRGAGHGMGGQGAGSGDCMQAAETARSGDMHGAGSGMGTGGMMPSGGMH